MPGLHLQGDLEINPTRFCISVSYVKMIQIVLSYLELKILIQIPFSGNIQKLFFTSVRMETKPNFTNSVKNIQVQYA